MSSRELLGGGSTGGYWFTLYEHKIFVECAILICMMLVAILFERLHHAIHAHISGFHSGVHVAYCDALDHEIYDREEEEEAHSHHGGKASAHVKGGSHHRLDLLTRVNGEFMVLGFLAFVVWTLNQLTFFEWIAGFMNANTSMSFNRDVTGSDLLHISEEVHIHLFLAMVLNFCCAEKVVRTLAYWQVTHIGG